MVFAGTTHFCFPMSVGMKLLGWLACTHDEKKKIVFMLTHPRTLNPREF